MWVTAMLPWTESSRFTHDNAHLESAHKPYPLRISQRSIQSAQAQAYGEELRSKTHSAHVPNAEITALVTSLKTCAINNDLCKGTSIHDDISKRGLLNQCCDALVTMYVKCGALTKAEELLDTCKSRNLITWTAVIAGYARHGQGQEALDCFEQMLCSGLSPDGVTYACILKACGSIGAIDKGRQIHDKIFRQGLLGQDIVLANCLMDMYAKCGDLPKAQQVLEELSFPDVVSWNALITGYSQQGQSKQALECFERMQCGGVSPNAVTFASVLKACGNIGAVDKGEQIHDRISKQGLHKDNVILGTALIDMYAKCGALVKARQVLEELSARNVISWSALITAYADRGQDEQALSCFEQMQLEGICPDTVTFACILKVYGSLGTIDKGKQVHREIVRQGLLVHDSVLATALVDMYAKCGAFAKARQLLEELPNAKVVSWNALVAGYVQANQNEEALSCFTWMQQKGLSPDSLTFTCILKACASLRAANKAEQIHGWILGKGLLYKDVVLGTALMDMYAKCGALGRAARILEDIPARDVVSWNALIAGYTYNGQGGEALDCFEQMKGDGLLPNVVTFASVLKACGNVGAVDKGAEIHKEIASRGLIESGSVLATAMVDMYAKCGGFTKAWDVLEGLPSPDVGPWNALLAGYAQHGQAEQALLCFEQMQCKGISPDTITITSVLNACSLLGLVEQGHTHFASMSSKYGLKPGLEHFTCMVDLYGRSGHLDKAADLIEELECSDFSAVWSTVLSACVKWGDENMGRWAFEQAIKVDKTNDSAYILMANIYAAAGKHEDVRNINTLRLENKV